MCHHVNGFGHVTQTHCNHGLVLGPYLMYTRNNLNVQLGLTRTNYSCGQPIVFI